MAVKIPIRDPISQIDTTAADAFSALNDLVLKLAQTGIENKTAQQEKRVSNAMSLLSDLKRKKDNIELSYLEKQAQIAAYTGEGKDLSDIYKTGSDGKLGSNIEDITADLYTEPFKYIEQSRQVIQNQMDILNPQIMNSIDQLAKLSQAQDFLTKGVGATYITGTTDTQKGMWGTEDLSQAAFKEKFYPGDQVLPESVKKYFKRTPVDPTFISDLEEKRIDREWKLREREMAEKGFDVSMQKHRIEIGAEKPPYSKELERSLEIAARVNKEIGDSGSGMMMAGMHYGMHKSAITKGDDGLEHLENYDVETFRIGLLFDPESKTDFNIALDVDIRSMRADDLKDIYEKATTGKNKVLAARAIEVGNMGKEIFSENDITKKINVMDIKRGVDVDPSKYLGKEELVARAYRTYRDTRDFSYDEAKKYAADIEFILGVNLQHEGSIRKRLREYFEIDYMQAAIGTTLDFKDGDNWSDKLNLNQKLLVGEWMDHVQNRYHYDIRKKQWITNITTAGVVYE